MEFYIFYWIRVHSRSDPFQRTLLFIEPTRRTLRTAVTGRALDGRDGRRLLPPASGSRPLPLLPSAAAAAHRDSSSAVSPPPAGTGAAVPDPSLSAALRYARRPSLAWWGQDPFHRGLSRRREAPRDLQPLSRVPWVPIRPAQEIRPVVSGAHLLLFSSPLFFWLDYCFTWSSFIDSQS